ncbi:hypothetical protein DB771_14880 [Burkholderia sp. AU29985]|nr:hypothetical protein XM57_02190 [Burkholderia cepacia]AYZ95701.1 hypothetical protein EGY28_10965 [Burkholderia dolosa]ETP61655.1 hypothetical protein BDSB_28335 [Burkholderia dolosa PC543]PRE51935.1 hypothetical protein C6P87_09465 [Burkholderia sp. AU12872]PUA76117.1 hypothetical protein DB771_14880 [Burkholderia sp. AU29985]
MPGRARLKRAGFRTPRRCVFAAFSLRAAARADRGRARRAGASFANVAASTRCARSSPRAAGRPPSHTFAPLLHAARRMPASISAEPCR